MAMDEKSSSSSTFLPYFNIPNLIPQSFRPYIDQFSEWRNRLGLQNPGTIEGLHKEVQRDVFLTNFAFSGMKADLGRSFCANPLFQVQHSFSAGSSQVAPWSFLSMYATDNVRSTGIIYFLTCRSFCKGIWIAISNLWRDVILLLIQKMSQKS